MININNLLQAKKNFDFFPPKFCLKVMKKVNKSLEFLDLKIKPQKSEFQNKKAKNTLSLEDFRIRYLILSS